MIANYSCYKNLALDFKTDVSVVLNEVVMFWAVTLTVHLSCGGV